MLTWIIEHTLLLLPTWFWFVVAGAGAVIYFLSGFIAAIPTFIPYARFIKIIGGVLLLGGIYLCGGAGVTALWQDETAKWQAKVDAAEAKSKQANEDLANALKDKKNKNKDVQIIIQERIKEVEKKLDAECRVPPEAISILNDAAKNEGGKK